LNQRQEPELKKSYIQIRLHDGRSCLAIRYEIARTIDDVLSRRVRLLFLDARAAISLPKKSDKFKPTNLDAMKTKEKIANPVLKTGKRIFNRISNRIITTTSFTQEKPK
jgi:glycerol-3-phosphate dehydrogenase